MPELLATSSRVAMAAGGCARTRGLGEDAQKAGRVLAGELVDSIFKVNPMNMKALIVIWLGASIACGAFGSASVVMDPLEVSMRYDNEVSLKVAQEKFRGLTEVTMVVGGAATSVPAGLLKDIVSPELGGIKYTQTAVEGDERVDVVVIQYDRRPYSWGEDVSEVRFLFSKKEVRRKLSIPTGEGTRRVVGS